MKKSITILTILLLVLSCHKTEYSPGLNKETNELYATIESIVGTKTTMDENNNVLWSEGDQLIFFRGSTLGDKYEIMEQYVGLTTGGFRKITESGSSDEIYSGQELDHNIALYPYSEEVWCMKNDNNSPTSSYKLNVVLPATQYYSENSFGNGSFPMLAISGTNQITFKNICGGLKLSFKGEDKIQSIKLEGLNNEGISGKSLVVGYVNGDAPTITMDANKSTKSITLDCGEGVQLSEDKATTFILSVPPVTFEGGMKITVTDSDGLSRTLTNSSKNTIKRSTLLTFPVITYTQEGVFELQEGTQTSYEIMSEGGVVEIPIVTNQDYEVVIPSEAGEWITLSETKAVREETITLNISENTTSESRLAEVLITTTTGETLQTIIVEQERKVSVITYTTTDGEALTIDSEDFDAEIVSHTYEDGEGVITFGGTLTEIGDWAFSECDILTSITLPEGLIEIGVAAFLGCFEMTSIVIPSTVVNIGDLAFDNCINLTSINIPDGVTEIGYGTFSQCQRLSSVNLPNNLSSIGSEAFFDCLELTSIVIPSTVENIGEAAFSACLDLETFEGKFATQDGRCLIMDDVLVAFAPKGVVSYSIPSTVSIIKGAVFYGCYELESITIPESVLSIQGHSAFNYCSNLINVYCKAINPPVIGDATSVPIGGTAIFDNNASDRKIHVKSSSLDAYRAAQYWSEYAADIVGDLDGIGHTISYTTTDGEALNIDSEDFDAEIVSHTYEDGEGVITFGGTLTEIGVSPFSSGYSSLTTITLPEGVTKIGPGAFANYESLTSIALPSSLTLIGNATFYNCSSLSAITLPNGLIYIGDNAFSGCSSLSSITLPNELTHIGGSAFSACNGLTSITIPESVTSFGDNNPFGNCDNLNSFYGKYASSDRRCIIKDGVLISFASSNISTYNIPEGVTYIGYYAFSGCEDITSITLSSTITHIGEGAFRGCSTFTNIDIPNGVTHIGEGAFDGCSSLTSITIPESVTSFDCDPSFDFNPFSRCDNLKSFNGKYASSDGRCIIKDGVLISFAPSNTSTYNLLEGVTHIGEGAFDGCSSLTSITIPEGVTHIGSFAFFDCNGLTSITIPESVTQIGELAFSSCSNLTNVYCKPAAPPTLENSSVFNNNASGRKIHVKPESVDAYMSVNYWSEYAAYIVGDLE